MGSKVSVVRGVKSDHFYEQRNGINEIWAGDVEIISRLPFGDSDQEQSAWPVGGVPKIPWHQFIIPLRKRDDSKMTVQNIASRAPVQNYTIVYSFPTTGYVGMYSGTPDVLVSILGSLFLVAAIMLVMTRIPALNTIPPSRTMSFRRPVLPGSEAAVARHLLQSMYLKMARKTGVILLLAILLVVLALPALATAARNSSGSDAILSLGAGMSIGFFVTLLLWVGWLMFVWRPKPEDKVEEVEMEAQTQGISLNTAIDPQK